MNNGMTLTLALACLLAALGCQKKSSPETIVTTPPAPGSFYSLSDGEGGFRVGKVAATSEEVVFVFLFSNRWTKRPLLEQADQATTPAPVAYSPETFAGMLPVLIKTGSVSPEETEAYEAWQRGKRETF